MKTLQRSVYQHAVQRTIALLASHGIVLTSDEQANLVLFPRQTCPEHLHPPIGDDSQASRKRLDVGRCCVFTIQPGIKHWFQAGDEGAIVSEFSSTSRDEYARFTDPTIERIQQMRRTCEVRIA